LDALNARQQNFPLTEWIDRRIGGEIETVPVGKGGAIEIRTRTKPAPAPQVARVAEASALRPPMAHAVQPVATPAKGWGKEAFFARLPVDQFSVEEEALRTAVIDFVTKFGERASLGDMMQDPRVVHHHAAFLPEYCSLRDWIEHRIGGEVELLHDKVKKQYIVRLLGDGHDQPQGLERVRLKEEFFNRLPPNGFTREEEQLRAAIIKFIKKWPHPCAASMSELGGDGEVKRWRPQLLKKGEGVSMKEWIEKRIGGEVDTMEDPEGVRGVLVGFPGKLQQQAKIPKEHGKGAKAKGKGKEEMSGGKGEPSTVESDSVTAFLNSLPQDDLSDDEFVLKEALLAYLLEHADQPGPQLLYQAAKDPTVAAGCSALLPATVPLHAWIEKRVWKEVEIRKEKGSDGRWILETPEAAKERREKTMSDRLSLKEEFLESLPSDGFTRDEEELRAALIRFLDSWPHAGAPKYDDACQDPGVQRYKAAVLPRGCPVNFKAWIENRIGGEIETLRDPRDDQLCIGFVGKLDGHMMQRRVDTSGKGVANRGGDRDKAREGKGAGRDSGKAKGKNLGGGGAKGSGGHMPASKKRRLAA